ncbi:MAG: glycosyltransferase family 2 protein [Hormoscilla sp. GM7CHS1pb]|nr:glycosyltransferase family 2 protein [Hormoscilla sp. GM7CHS1pb]
MIAGFGYPNRPLRNNQKGIDLFLTNFFQTHNSHLYPQEIIIVDNNSQPEITIPQQYQVKSVPIRLLKCSKIGPAAARNVGIKHAKGDWILFTDSDCIPSGSFIQGYLQAMNGSIGYAGNVKAWGNSIANGD